MNFWQKIAFAEKMHTHRYIATTKTEDLDNLRTIIHITYCNGIRAKVAYTRGEITSVNHYFEGSRQHQSIARNHLARIESISRCIASRVFDAMYPALPTPNVHPMQ